MGSKRFIALTVMHQALYLRSPDFSRNALPDYLMGFASTPTTAFGHQRATECIVTHPMARSLEKSKSLKLYQTSALEGRG